MGRKVVRTFSIDSLHSLRVSVCQYNDSLLLIPVFLVIFLRIGVLLHHYPQLFIVFATFVDQAVVRLLHLNLFRGKKALHVQLFLTQSAFTEESFAHLSNLIVSAV